MINSKIDMEFEEEIYLKLKEVEKEAEANDKRYSIEETIQGMRDSIAYDEEIQVADDDEIEEMTKEEMQRFLNHEAEKGRSEYEALKGLADIIGLDFPKLGGSEDETIHLTSIPKLKDKIIDGVNEPLGDCISLDEVEW